MTMQSHSYPPPHARRFNELDYWRRKYLMPAIDSGQTIALVGTGDAEEYLRDFRLDGELEQVWDPFRLHKTCAPERYCVYDLNAESIERAQALGIQAEVRDVCLAPLPEKYDYIFCASVMAYVHNLYAFMANLKESLSDRGLLVLTTPNSVYFRNCLTDRYHELDEHLCAFNQKHFLNWSAFLGLPVVELATFQALPARRSLKVALRKPLYALMDKLGRSNSIICVLKRRPNEGAS